MGRGPRGGLADHGVIVFARGEGERGEGVDVSTVSENDRRVAGDARPTGAPERGSLEEGTPGGFIEREQGFEADARPALERCEWIAVVNVERGAGTGS
jgi:hypothetical protein